jgi:hypothetical protein
VNRRRNGTSKLEAQGFKRSGWDWDCFLIKEVVAINAIQEISY